jgi:acyl carrier protein
LWILNNMDKKIIEKIFISTINLKKNIDITKLKYGDHNWDSIIHMQLISNLEKKFRVAIDTEDVIDMSSFNKALKILKKYKK